MANKEGHRGFGNVRKLPSGRWQARYPGPDGQLRNAPRTFAGKREAEQWLSLTEAQLVTGDWTDPARAKIRLADYAAKWINERPGFGRTRRPCTSGCGPSTSVLGSVRCSSARSPRQSFASGALTCWKTVCRSP